MSHHDIFENRKQFQLERLILFSDAVLSSQNAYTKEMYKISKATSN